MRSPATSSSTPTTSTALSRSPRDAPDSVTVAGSRSARLSSHKRREPTLREPTASMNANGKSSVPDRRAVDGVRLEGNGRPDRAAPRQPDPWAGGGGGGFVFFLGGPEEGRGGWGLPPPPPGTAWGRRGAVFGKGGLFEPPLPRLTPIESLGVPPRRSFLLTPEDI